MKIELVILAGGSGSRLWPFSRTKRPKQFLSISADSISMLQNTIKRVLDVEFSNITVICNEEHRFFASEKLNEIGLNQC